MEKLKLLLKHEREIVEGLLICLVGGWAMNSVITGTFKKISDLDYCYEMNIPAAICTMIVCTGVLAGLYLYHAGMARILSFLFVYMFTLLCAYSAYGVQWGSTLNNTIGNACFLMLLCFVQVLAFLYVKEDIFHLFRKLRIQRKSANIIIMVLTFAFFVFVGGVGVLRYLSYGNSTYDFGIFAQMFEYMKQKGVPSTTLERSYLLSHFAVHFSPIFYLALPIYFLFSSPVTVQLVQAVMVVLPVIPIVLLCRHYKMSNWMVVALSLLYMLYPATAGGTFYDIHENCFLTFFLLMTMWAVEKKKNMWIAVFGILVLLVKEDAAVYLVIFGTYLLFSRRDKRRGIILMVASVLYFVAATAIVNHFGLGIMDNRFSNFYFDSDGGLGQVVWTIFLNPAYVMGQMVTNYSPEKYDKIEYIIVMLVPIAGALLTTGKKYSRYILTLPFIVINVSTIYLYMHDIGFQYNFGVIALFMYMIIMNLSDVKVEKAKTLASVSVLCAGIMFMGMIFPKLSYYVTLRTNNKEMYRRMDDALKEIPEDASVCASGYLTPHLWKHLELYDQRYVEGDVDTDYLAVDRRYSNESSQFDDVLEAGKYQSVYRVDDVIEIYRKTVQ